MEASLATTFRACSSHAPTPVKPQPASAILSQESVHTTLSITHHTRKRPSTGPRTTQVLNIPLDECIDYTHVLVTKEKRKRKETTKRNLNKRSKAKGKGNNSTQLRQNKLTKRAQTTKTKLENHKELPLHTCKLPLLRFDFPPPRSLPTPPPSGHHPTPPNQVHVSHLSPR
jgi:hypothetical protein